MFAYRFDDTVYRLSTVMNFAYTNTEKYGLYKMEWIEKLHADTFSYNQ